MKFKVGDMVKCLDCSRGKPTPVLEMIGGIFEIKSVGNADYRVYNKDKSNDLVFAEEDLELAESNPEKATKPKNLFPLIAKELGVEIGEEFGVSTTAGRFYFEQDCLLEKGNHPCDNVHRLNSLLALLLSGHSKIEKLPHKPTLTETERVVLKELCKKYTKITRIENTDLWVFNHEKDWKELCALSHLFQFIKANREPYDIAELLVVEECKQF